MALDFKSKNKDRETALPDERYCSVDGCDLPGDVSHSIHGGGWRCGYHHWHNQVPPHVITDRIRDNLDQIRLMGRMSRSPMCLDSSGILWYSVAGVPAPRPAWADGLTVFQAIEHLRGELKKRITG